MGIELIAKELVETTKKIVENRTINVMNINGMIIASSDNERIGSFHQGAKLVIETGETVWITVDNIADFEGSRQGINMPICIGGKIMGVVGIYGNPDEIVDVANLLQLYAVHILKHGIIAKEQLHKKGIRNQILQRLLCSNENKEVDINELCELVSLKLIFPLKVIVIDTRKDQIDSLYDGENYEKIEQYLLVKNCIHLNQDVFGVINHKFIILKSSLNCELEERMGNELDKLLEGKFQLAIGENIKSRSQIHFSYQQEIDLLHISKKDGCINMKEPSVKMKYLYYDLLKGDTGNCMKHVFDNLYHQIGEGEIKEIMDTVKAYCDYDGSINKSADSLYIHKNTMLYRIKKIVHLLEIQKESNFVKDFYMQLLLVYYNNK